MKKIISVVFLLLHSLNFYSALDQELRQLLVKAAQAGDESKALRIMSDARFREIYDYDLGRALISATENGYKDIVQMIMDNPRFREISNVYLNEAFWNVVQNRHENIVQMFMNNPRFREISNTYLGRALMVFAQNGHKNIVQMFINNPIFREISNVDLGLALMAAAQNNHKDIVQMFMNNPRFREISNANLSRALMAAAQNGRENIVKMLLQDRSSIEISPEDLNKALELAVQGRHEGCANWLKAYTALKPDLDPATLDLLDKQFRDGYLEFIYGKPQDLRNLVFPIRAQKSSFGSPHVSDVYALAPQADKEIQAVKIIETALFKLFKKDHIKPLLLSLVETEHERSVALEHIKFMKLTKKDIAASKIQTAFRGYRARVNLPKYQPQRDETVRTEQRDEEVSE